MILVYTNVENKYKRAVNVNSVLRKKHENAKIVPYQNVRSSFQAFKKPTL